MFEEQANALGFYFRYSPVGKRMPVVNLAAQIEWKAADTEIRIPIGDRDGHFACRIEFSGSKGGADPGIASSDDYNVGHKILLPFGVQWIR